MKSKGLAITNGVVGLVGGIFLILWIFFLAGAGNNGAVFLTLVKIVILALGIVGLIYYKGTKFGATGNILLVVGGAVALIPLLGWAGGIVALVGGAICLARVKRLKEQN
jgi:hypothetical protein